MIGTIFIVVVLLLFLLRDRFLVCTVVKHVVTCGNEAALFRFIADLENATEWDVRTRPKI